MCEGLWRGILRRAGVGAVLAAGMGALGQGVPSVPVPVADQNVSPVQLPPLVNLSGKSLFKELELLRTSDFVRAREATVAVRVRDKHGNYVPGLNAGDFQVMVNGTRRVARLRPQGHAVDPTHLPLVLLVFPPNQPMVHGIAVKDALKYFGGQAGAVMPWRVGIFDANGSFLAFTSDRQELLANLRAVSVAKEPMQFMGYGWLSVGESTWMEKAERAISNMERTEGPRLILAMNPLASPYGMNAAGNGAPLAVVGPADLVAAANFVGAHIYIDAAGGPEPIIPGGDAAGNGSIYGTVPSGNGRISPQQTAALNYFAYSNSLMMVTARNTFGGFAGSIGDLAAQMQRDLDQAYVLEFDLAVPDRDLGVPHMQVIPARPELRMVMVDLAAVKVEVPAEPAAELANKVLRAMEVPVVSPEFRISQRVDYFPVRMGMGAAPILPMTALVEWTGKGPRPEALSIAEAVQDADLSQPVLGREMEAAWQSRSVRWERDGQLHPGHYVWLVAVHDASGKVLTSAKEQFTVAYPRGDSLEVSSLVVGTDCRPIEESVGPMRRRKANEATEDKLRLTADPLQVGGCRLVPGASGRYRVSDTLRALVRIYPSGKMERNRPEAWGAHFTLRGVGGGVEATGDAVFGVDSGTGLVATVVVPLDGVGVHPGEHVLEVEMRGPGVKRGMKMAQDVVVDPR